MTATQTVNDRLASLESKADQILAMLAGGTTPPADPGPPLDLDGPRGNPEVRFDPKRYLEGGGESYKGKRMKDCPPDYLLALAEAFEYFARKNDENNVLDKNGGPKSKWDFLDARRARAWAERNKEIPF